MPLTKTLLALALWVAPSMALAQVDLRVHIPLPTIRFEAPPPLVVVTEGVQVVPDRDDEVFYTDGWYWYRVEDRWYRTRNHRGGWILVERRYVPATLVGFPPGRYRRHPGKGHAKHHLHHPDGQVTEVKVKHRGRHGEVKWKEKKGKGKWK